MQTRHEEYHSGETVVPCIPFLHLRRFAERPAQITNWHDNLEVQICVAGEGFVLLDGERFPFRVGDVVVVNTNQVHYTGTDSEVTYHCAILGDTFCRIADIPYQQLRFDTLFRDEEIAGVFNEIVALQDRRTDPCYTAKLQLAVTRLLIALRERHTVQHTPQAIAKPSYDNVKRAMRYIREHYAERVTLTDLSRHILSDKYGLCKSFKRLTGQTVVQYLNNYRCVKAKEFWRKGRTVSETALLCGFHNMSFFTKTFKEQTGKLPSAYKKSVDFG